MTCRSASMILKPSRICAPSCGAGGSPAPRVPPPPFPKPTSTGCLVTLPYPATHVEPSARRAASVHVRGDAVARPHAGSAPTARRQASRALGHHERGYTLSAAHGCPQERAVSQDGRCSSRPPLLEDRNRFHFDQHIGVGQAPHFDRGTGGKGPKVRHTDVDMLEELLNVRHICQQFFTPYPDSHHDTLRRHGALVQREVSFSRCILSYCTTGWRLPPLLYLSSIVTFIDMNNRAARPLILHAARPLTLCINGVYISAALERIDTTT